MFLFGNHRLPGFGCCSDCVCFPSQDREKEELVCHVGITIRITRSLGQDTASGGEYAVIPALQRFGKCDVLV